MPVKFYLILLLLVSPALLAAPKADLWDRWTMHDAASSLQIEHRAWSNLLQLYLRPGPDGVNRFAYGEVSVSDRRLLDEYIDRLAQTAISQYNRAEQRAYWINIYNALTIQEVLRHYPVESIRDISSGLFSTGPWNKKLVSIEREALSLNDIEHRILRPVWQDPRIHYAVNCASIGCPNLQPQAFTAELTDAMLEQAARDFINHPRGAAVIDGELRVSSIYDWFVSDFGGNDAGVIEHLKRYANAALAEALHGMTEIDDDQYDWRINSASDVDRARLDNGYLAALAVGSEG